MKHFVAFLDNLSLMPFHIKNIIKIQRSTRGSFEWKAESQCEMACFPWIDFDREYRAKGDTRERYLVPG